MTLLLVLLHQRGLQRWNRFARCWFLMLGSILLCPWATFAAQVALTWEDNATTETGFRIERRIDGEGDYVWLAAVDANVVIYNDGNVTSGKTYCYRVQSYNPGGPSSYSNDACVTVSPIILNFESPESGQAVAGLSVIRGWAFDSAVANNIQRVDLFVDGVLVGEIPCCSPRGDVRAAFPQFPAASTENSGWGTVVNWGVLPPGSHTVQIKIFNSGGEVSPSDTRTVTVVNPGAAFADIFSLSGASVKVMDQDLVLSNVRVRDKETQQQNDVTLTFRWLTNSQSFGMTQAVIVRKVAASEASIYARVMADLRRWWHGTTFGPASAYAASRIIAFLESPEGGQTVFGINVLRGWAFDEDGQATVRTVRLTVDNVPVLVVPCCAGRQDVAAVFPQNRNAADSGWGLTVNYANLSAGSHTIGIEIESSSGTTLSTARQVTVAKVAGFDYLDLVDFAKANARIDGEDIVISDILVRDRASQQTKTVQLRLRWVVNSQSLGIVAAN
jgi:hypothetical protein